MPLSGSRGDVVGAPAGLHGAGEFLRLFERLDQIARRVAFAAMRQRFGQIGAAVPFRAALAYSARSACRGLKSSDQTPISQRWLNGKTSVFVGRGGMHGLEAEQIGLDRQRIGVGHHV